MPSACVLPLAFLSSFKVVSFYVTFVNLILTLLVVDIVHLSFLKNNTGLSIHHFGPERETAQQPLDSLPLKFQTDVHVP